MFIVGLYCVDIDFNCEREQLILNCVQHSGALALFTPTLA
jgi:hypothetical protein